MLPWNKSNYGYFPVEYLWELYARFTKYEALTPEGFAYLLESSGAIQTKRFENVLFWNLKSSKKLAQFRTQK